MKKAPKRLKSQYLSQQASSSFATTADATKNFFFFLVTNSSSRLFELKVDADNFLFFENCGRAHNFNKLVGYALNKKEDKT